MCCYGYLMGDLMSLHVVLLYCHWWYFFLCVCVCLFPPSTSSFFLNHSLMVLTSWGKIRYVFVLMGLGRQRSETESLKRTHHTTDGETVCSQGLDF